MQSCLGAVGLVLAIARPLFAQWQAVVPGIDYAEFTISGPNNLFVARMDRTAANLTIDSSIAQGKLVSGTERTSLQAARYHDAINYWDQTWGAA